MPAKLHSAKSAKASKKGFSDSVALGRKAVPAKVVIVDDHPIVREGLARVINQCTDMVVSGEADNISTAVEIVERQKPNLVVVDISLGSQSGIELIKDIKARQPMVPVLVNSMFDESLYAPRCLRAGASGYLMKHERPAILIEAMRRVLRGEVHLSPKMTQEMLSQMPGGRANRGATPAEVLSDREFEVYELLGRGHRTKEIAHMLNLSDKTVQTHREHIKEKLEIKDAIALVRHAMRWAESRM